MNDQRSQKLVKRTNNKVFGIKTHIYLRTSNISQFNFVKEFYLSDKFLKCSQSQNKIYLNVKSSILALSLEVLLQFVTKVAKCLAFYKMFCRSTLREAAMAEWLRRWTRNPMGAPRAGSNPARSVIVYTNFFEQPLVANVLKLLHFCGKKVHNVIINNDKKQEV